MHVILAKPRGFCAGVERAIAIVEEALTRFGLPLYVKHAIVHNRHEVERLKRSGVVFVESLAEVPEGSRVVLSAHGSPPATLLEARVRGLEVIDAVCPLVTKVHNEVKHYAKEGNTILLIGHKGHVEVAGTQGEAPEHTIVIGSVEEAEHVSVADPDRVAYTTQTTLSVDDTQAIVAVLTRRFPKIAGPRKADICYATQNRQDAVKILARRADLVIVFGSPESSNANRLVEVARKEGARALLLEDVHMLTGELLRGVLVLGISSGASTPERLIDEVLATLKTAYGATSVETLVAEDERVHFALPRILQTNKETM